MAPASLFVLLAFLAVSVRAALPSVIVDGVVLYLYEDSSCMKRMVPSSTFISTATFGACGSIELGSGYGVSPSITVGAGGQVIWSVYSSRTCSGSTLASLVTPFTRCTAVTIDGTAMNAFVEPFLRLPTGVAHNITATFYSGAACDISTSLGMATLVGDDTSCKTVTLGSGASPLPIKALVNPTSGAVTWNAYAAPATSCSGTPYLSGSNKAIGQCHSVTDNSSSVTYYRLELKDNTTNFVNKPVTTVIEFFGLPSSCSSSGVPVRSITIQGSQCTVDRLPAASANMSFSAKYDVLNGLVDVYAYVETACLPTSTAFSQTAVAPNTCLTISDTTSSSQYYVRVRVSELVGTTPTSTATATRTPTSTATATRTPTSTATTTGTATQSMGAATLTPSPTRTRSPTPSPSMLPAPPAPVVDALSLTFYSDERCSSAYTIGFMYAKSGQCTIGSLNGKQFALFATATTGVNASISWSAYDGEACTGTALLSSSNTKYSGCQSAGQVGDTSVYVNVNPELRFRPGRPHNVSVTFFSTTTCTPSSAINADAITSGGPLDVVGDGATCSVNFVQSIPAYVGVRASYASGKVAWSAFANLTSGSAVCKGAPLKQSPTGSPTALGECVTVSTAGPEGTSDLAFRLSLNDFAMDLMYPPTNLVLDVFSSDGCNAASLTDSVTILSATEESLSACRNGSLSLLGPVSLRGYFNAVEGTATVAVWAIPSSFCGHPDPSLAFGGDVGTCGMTLTPSKTLIYFRIRAATPPSPSRSPNAGPVLPSASGTPSGTSTPSVTPQSLATAKLTLAGVSLAEALSAGADFINPIRQAVAVILNVTLSAVRVTGLRAAVATSRLLAASPASPGRALFMRSALQAEGAGSRSLAETTGVIADIEVRAPPATAAKFQAIMNEAVTNSSSPNAAVLSQMESFISAATSTTITLDTTALMKDFSVLTPAQQVSSAPVVAGAASSDSLPIGAAAGAAVGGLVVGAIASWLLAMNRSAAAKDAAVAAALAKANTERVTASPLNNNNPMANRVGRGDFSPASVSTGRGRAVGVPPAPVTVSRSRALDLPPVPVNTSYNRY
jgi:hypothetical protein